MDKRCTVVVNSCDKYEEAWDPFFSLLKIYWPDCNYNIVLNTESKKFSREDMDVNTINSLEHLNKWGARARHVLGKIETPYVIMLLEDFFLQDFVDNQEIEKSINRMETNSNIAVFYFKKITGFDIVSENYPDYIEMGGIEEYKLNCQAALWNRKALIELLDDNETPWEFESFGQNRCTNPNQEFYCVKKGSYLTYKGDVFPYLWSLDSGYGICKSEWLWNNEELFRKHNIKYEMKSLKKLSKYKHLTNKYFKEIRRRIRRNID